MAKAAATGLTMPEILHTQPDAAPMGSSIEDMESHSPPCSELAVNEPRVQKVPFLDA